MLPELTRSPRLVSVAFRVAMVIGVILLGIVYVFAWLAPSVGLYHDDGIYLVTAKALAEGQGYRIISLPTVIPQSKYPFLFPLALFLSVPLLVGDLSYMTTTTKAVYAATSIVVALKEVITFRVLIQNLLAMKFGNLIGVLLTTVLFTVYHIGAIRSNRDPPKRC